MLRAMLVLECDTTNCNNQISRPLTETTEKLIRHEATIEHGWLANDTIEICPPCRQNRA